jgi:hypothetical protein
VDSELLGDVAIDMPLGAPKDDPGSQGQLLGGLAATNEGFERLPLRLVEHQFNQSSSRSRHLAPHDDSGRETPRGLKQFHRT